MMAKPKPPTPLFEPRYKGLVAAVATSETLAKIKGAAEGAGDNRRVNRSLNRTPNQAPPPTVVQEPTDPDDVRRREAQNHELLKAMERGDTITVSTARVLCGTWRLADRMADIRGMLERHGEAGRLVQTGTGVNAEYRLRNPKAGTPGDYTP